MLLFCLLPDPGFSDELDVAEEDLLGGGGLFELDLIEQDWPINDNNNRNLGSFQKVEMHTSKRR